MTGDMEDFRAAVTTQEFSPILTHCTPVFVWVVLFSFRVCLAVAARLRAADATPLRAVGKHVGLCPIGEMSAAFGDRLLRVAAGRWLVLAMRFQFYVLSQGP